MNEFKGTKGKWRIEDSSFYQNRKVIFSDYENRFTDKIVIQGIIFNEDEDESKANALLISKAPEMLEMMEEIQRRVSIIISEPNGIVRETMINNLNLGIENLIKEATEI
jgi:hypothetical protein